MDDVIIDHNPDCGTSRNTLGLIRNAGIQPHVIEYLECPPSCAMLQALIARMGIAVRDLILGEGILIHDLGLDDPSLTDDQLLDAMMAHRYLDQLADRGDTARRQVVPAFGDSARIASVARAVAKFRKEDGELGGR